MLHRFTFLHPFHHHRILESLTIVGARSPLLGQTKVISLQRLRGRPLKEGERGGYSIWHSGRLASTSILSSWSNCHKENFGTTSIVWEHLSKYKYSNNAQIWHCFNWSQIFSQHCPVFVMPPVFMSKKMEEWQPFTLFEGIWHVDLKKGWGRG